MAIKFGWCLDGHHDDCRVHYRDRYEPEKIIQCACDCHTGKKKPELPIQKAMPDPEKRVRKPRRTKK